MQKLGVDLFDAAFAVAQFLQKFLWGHVVGLGQRDDAEVEFLLVDANAFFLGDFGKDELSLHALFGGLIGRGVNGVFLLVDDFLGNAASLIFADDVVNDVAGLVLDHRFGQIEVDLVE